MENLKPRREFLKNHFWDVADTLETDQKKRLPPPPVERPILETAPRIGLIRPGGLYHRRAVASGGD